MDIYQQLIANAQFAGTVPALVPLPSISGASLYFENQSPYGFKVMDTGQSIEIDYIQPFGYLQMPYRASLALAIDKAVQSAQTSPFEYLGVKFTDNVFAYAKGSLISQGITDVQGNMTATINGAVQANITNASLPVTGNVGITSGSVNATIQNAQLNANVINTTGSPAYMQPSTGSFPIQYAISATIGATGAATVLVPAAQGGYIQALQLTIQGTGSAGETVQIQNGAQNIENAILVNNGSTVSKQYNFGQGVANNGITITETAFSAGSGMTVTGYAVITQNAAPLVPATIH